MRDKVRALALEYDMLPAGGRILCAVSGGADSMCLLHLLGALGEELGFTVAAAHFNHRLRGEESARDAAFVERWCRERDIPFTLGEGDVSARARQLGRGLEEPAREMRYAFLRRAAEEVKGALLRRRRDGMELAVPFSPREPFPLVPLICLGRLQRIGGRRYLVFSLDGRGAPRVWR